MVERISPQAGTPSAKPTEILGLLCIEKSHKLKLSSKPHLLWHSMIDSDCLQSNKVGQNIVYKAFSDLEN